MAFFCARMAAVTFFMSAGKQIGEVGGRIGGRRKRLNVPGINSELRREFVPQTIIRPFGNFCRNGLKLWAFCCVTPTALLDLVLHVALAINAELLCEDLLDSPAVLVRPLHNFLCKGYPMRFAKLDLPFSCPRPQIIQAMGVFTVGEKRDKRPNSRLKSSVTKSGVST
jgi:hypothetical protein